MNRLEHPGTGRVMEVYTTEPGIQLYTGNILKGMKCKDGTIYAKHHSLCLETQKYPDAVHHVSEWKNARHIIASILPVI